MGLYDRFELKIPRANPSGWVKGKEFNDAVDSLLKIVKSDQNFGAYLAHPDQIGGAFPTMEAALGQAIQEVPAGMPIVISPLPNAVYEEDIVIPQEAAEDHDFYFMNQFEDYTDQEGTIEWRGSLTVPEIHTWPVI